MRREVLEAAWAVARDKGVASLTLSEVAQRVNMRPPSLYSHFPSKNAIFDAMFAQAWSEYLSVFRVEFDKLPAHPRRRLRRIARVYFEISVEDLPRFQLANQRVLPGFEPSAEAYRPSLDVMGLLTDAMAAIGICEQADIDLYAALVGGLVDAQWANNPGGRRYERLLDRAIDMYADHLGLSDDKE